MDKKDLKIYAAPALEVVELQVSGTLLTTSPGVSDPVTNPFHDNTEITVPED